MTKFTTQEVTVNKRAEVFFEYISDLSNLKDIMPTQIENFKSTNSTCSFKVTGMPTIELEITKKIKFSRISLTAQESQIPFSLNCFISEKAETTCIVRVEIDAELNMMTRMMVEKPLNNILEAIEKKLQKF